MMDMGEEYQLLASILKVFYAIGEKIIVLDSKVKILDDDRSGSDVTHDGAIKSNHSNNHLIQLETMLII